MTADISDEVKLYGTDEPVPAGCLLYAGPLRCELDQGVLRYIKVHDTEAIRNIAFVVRDQDWGTYQPLLKNVKINQQTDSFTVNYDASVQASGASLDYTIEIKADASGSLTFHARLVARGNFQTNRTGFVVLHPLSGICGQALVIEHCDGAISRACFPEVVDPVQPFRNIRSLTHRVKPGVTLRCEMVGDAFEMEDHRQWNDASFKTYIRPLAKPWPYALKSGHEQSQFVQLTVTTTDSVNEFRQSPSNPSAYAGHPASAKADTSRTYTDKHVQPSSALQYPVPEPAKAAIQAQA